MKPFIIKRVNYQAATIYLVYAESAQEAIQAFVESYYEKVFALELMYSERRYAVDSRDTLHVFNVHLPAPHQYPTQYSVLECYPTNSRSVWIVDP